MPWVDAGDWMRERERRLEDEPRHLPEVPADPELREQVLANLRKARSGAKKTDAAMAAGVFGPEWHEKQAAKKRAWSQRYRDRKKAKT